MVPRKKSSLQPEACSGTPGAVSAAARATPSAASRAAVSPSRPGRSASGLKIIVPASAANEIRSPKSGRPPESQGRTCSSTRSRNASSPSTSATRSVCTQASAGM